MPCFWSFKKSLYLLFILLSIYLQACSFPIRTGYDRNTGDYKKLHTSSSNTKKKQVNTQDTQGSNTNPGNLTKEEILREDPSKIQTLVKNSPKTPPPPSKKSFESITKSWIGTRYKLGGSTKNGADCSGFVMQIYKEKLQISLPHNAAAMFKMGQSISVKQLQEGDLVFFGNAWGINHVGIYLSNSRFIHASSSKGVIITPMNDSYWKPKYKGARRYTK